MPNYIHYGCQYQVSSIMTISVIEQFEIIQIDNCNSGIQRHIFDFFLKISAVICPCQHILIQLFAIYCQLFRQFFISFLISQCVFVQLFQHFHYIRLTVNLQIPCKYLIHIRIKKFNFGCLFLFIQRFNRNAILTSFIFIPESITLAKIFFSFKLIFHSVSLQITPFQETDYIKNLPKHLHFILCFLHRHLFPLDHYSQPLTNNNFFCNINLYYYITFPSYSTIIIFFLNFINIR